jgi:hypothetical protein
VKSIIADLPDGAEVTFRSILDRVVEIVYGHDDLYFSAVAPGRSCCDDDCEYYGRNDISDCDLPSVKRGGAFWLVVENVRDQHGYTERQSAIAFQHPGVDTAEAALTAPRPGGDVE